MFIAGGIVFICFGILIIRNPIYCRGYCADLSGYNVPFGCMCIIFGIFFIASEIRKRLRRKYKYREHNKEEHK